MLLFRFFDIITLFLGLGRAGRLCSSIAGELAGFISSEASVGNLPSLAAVGLVGASAWMFADVGGDWLCNGSTSARASGGGCFAIGSFLGPLDDDALFLWEAISLRQLSHLSLVVNIVVALVM